VLKARVVAALAAATLLLGLGIVIGRASAGGRPPVPEVIAGPGPGRIVAGVPMGFTRSEEGAVAAASAFSKAVDAALFATPSDRRKTLAAMTTEEARRQVTEATERIARVVAKGYGLPQSARKVVSRGAVLGYRVARYTTDSAEVELWGVGIAGRAGGPNPKSGWGTSTVELRWVGGDWRLAGVIEARDGPTPEATGSPTPAAQFVNEARSFREVDDDAAS
jgi:hypothetical protein